MSSMFMCRQIFSTFIVGLRLTRRLCIIQPVFWICDPDTNCDQWQNAIYLLCNDTVGSSDYTGWNDRLVIRWWIGRDMKGSTRGLIWSIILETAASYWEKPKEISARAACFRDEIWTIRIRAGVPHVRTSRSLPDHLTVSSKYKPWYNTV